MHLLHLPITQSGLSAVQPVFPALLAADVAALLSRELYAIGFIEKKSFLKSIHDIICSRNSSRHSDTDHQTPHPVVFAGAVVAEIAGVVAGMP